jgi:hypothetical protein
MHTMELPSLGETIRQALRLDPDIYAAIQVAPRGIWLALAVVFLACLSESVGQSIVLFINRVRPRRFGLALLTSTLSRIIGYAMWTASVWLVVTYVFGHAMPWLTVASAVGLAYAPQVLAFFVLTPFLGSPFAILLSLWSMVAIVVAVQVGLGLELWPAVITSGLGWLLIRIWQRTLGRPVYALGRWLERRAAGVPLEFTLNDMIRLRHWPRWLDQAPYWKACHLRAGRAVWLMNMAGREQSRGRDVR